MTAENTPTPTNAGRHKRKAEARPAEGTVADLELGGNCFIRSRPVGVGSQGLSPSGNVPLLESCGTLRCGSRSSGSSEVENVCVVCEISLRDANEHDRIDFKRLTLRGNVRDQHLVLSENIEICGVCQNVGRVLEH